MKDFKALVIVAAVIGVLYLGVEVLAHKVMHPVTAPVDYTFRDLEGIDLSQGDAVAGKDAVVSNCIACHSLKSQGFEAPMDKEMAAATYGVVPPDLSGAGFIYESNYLANFIKNPTRATQLDHKFSAEAPYPMPAYDWLSSQEIANMIAYFKSIAPSHMSNKEVFAEACQRCHAVRYDKVLADTPSDILSKHMGAPAPDLSTMIRSRGADYLHTFTNEPQKLLPGTAMPRVGLNENAEAQVVAYLESVGDSKKEERESLGIKVILYTILLTLIAYFWKRKIWREVH